MLNVEAIHHQASQVVVIMVAIYDICIVLENVQQVWLQIGKVRHALHQNATSEMTI